MNYFLLGMAAGGLVVSAGWMIGGWDARRRKLARALKSGDMFKVPGDVPENGLVTMFIPEFMRGDYHIEIHQGGPRMVSFGDRPGAR